MEPNTKTMKTTKFSNLKEAFGITESDVRSLVLKRIIAELKNTYPVEFLNEYPMPQRLFGKINSSMPYQEKIFLAKSYYEKLNKRPFISELFKTILPVCALTTYVDEKTDREALKVMLKRKFKYVVDEDIDSIPEVGYIYVHALKGKEAIKMQHFDKCKHNIEIICKLIYGEKFFFNFETNGIYNYGRLKIKTYKRSNQFYLCGGIDLFRKELILQLRNQYGNAVLIG